MKVTNLKLSISVIIMLMATVNTFAQTELKGKVIDFINYTPIQDASVYILNTTVGTITNSDGKFELQVPAKSLNDTLVISSIGYKNFKVLVSEYDSAEEIFLTEDVASLDEVIISSEPRPTTGNDIVLKAISKLEKNMPDSSYVQKGFLRHKERNEKEYKWLIESAITVYDSSYAANRDYLKVNVDENRKSYDLRDIDSLFVYASYLKYVKNQTTRAKDLDRAAISDTELAKAIKWNDERINGLDNLLKGKLNLVRNSYKPNALFGKNMLDKHQFKLDTVLVDNERKLYKIQIMESKDFVGLNTPNIYNEGFNAQGWIYIYWDNYAIKRIEYDLVAASDVQKKRSKSLYNTQTNHKLILAYKEFDEKMYPSYVYYETPKLVNAGDRSSKKALKEEAELIKEAEEQFYYTVQELLFTEVIQDSTEIQKQLQKKWSSDIFLQRPYNAEFWRNYNVLLESEEEEKLINDLSKRASLFKED